MSFAETLKRLNLIAETRQRGLVPGKVMVWGCDLKELLRHFYRVDNLSREYQAENADLHQQSLTLAEDNARLQKVYEEASQVCYDYAMGIPVVMSPLIHAIGAVDTPPNGAIGELVAAVRKDLNDCDYFKSGLRADVCVCSSQGCELWNTCQAYDKVVGK